MKNLMKHRVSIHAMYYKIASECEAEYWMQDSELQRLKNAPIAEEEIEENLYAQAQAYEKRERAAVIAITFAAMSLEAFFFDYAADALGDKLVEEHLDKLDLKSRFVVYPRLVAGKKLDKGAQAYEQLSTLQKIRNKLVHFKSRSFDLSDVHKASDYHDHLNNELRKGVENATKSVRSVMAELDTLHEDNTSFLRRLDWSSGS